MNIHELLACSANAKAQFKLHNFEQWLLDEGELMGPIVDDPDQDLREPKQCYSNAANAVMNYEVGPEWFYTEGVILIEKLPILIGHAWLSNAEGEVLEITSANGRAEGATYWGVPYRPEFLRRKLLEQKFYGLHQSEVHYLPITQGPLPFDARAWQRKEAK